MFENRVLRRILGPKKNETVGEWRKLHTEELYDLFYKPNIVMENFKYTEMGEICSTNVFEEECIQNLVGKSRRKETTRRSRRRLENNIT
jgi:hypothetical protein